MRGELGEEEGKAGEALASEARGFNLEKWFPSEARGFPSYYYYIIIGGGLRLCVRASVCTVHPSVTLFSMCRDALNPKLAG